MRATTLFCLALCFASGVSNAFGQLTDIDPGESKEATSSSVEDRLATLEKQIKLLNSELDQAWVGWRIKRGSAGGCSPEVEERTLGHRPGGGIQRPFYTQPQAVPSQSTPHPVIPADRQ